LLLVAVVVGVAALLNIFVEEIISLVVLLIIMLIDINWRFRSSHSSFWVEKTDDIPDERRRRMEMTTIMMSWYFITSVYVPRGWCCENFRERGVFEEPAEGAFLYKKDFDSFLFSHDIQK
jgi:hypothetical protein